MAGFKINTFDEWGNEIDKTNVRKLKDPADKKDFSFDASKFKPFPIIVPTEGFTIEGDNRIQAHTKFTIIIASPYNPVPLEYSKLGCFMKFIFPRELGVSKLKEKTKKDPDGSTLGLSGQGMLENTLGSPGDEDPDA